MVSWFVLILVLASLAALPLILAPMVARREMQRGSRIAARLVLEADERGVSDCPEYSALLDACLSIILVAPRVASGEKLPKSSTPSVDVDRFARDNKWAAPYMFTVWASFTQLTYFGRPWMVHRLGWVVFAEICFHSLADSDGLIQVSRTPAPPWRQFLNVSSNLHNLKPAA